MNAYRRGASGSPSRAGTPYQRGAMTRVGARFGNWPGWLLDQIHIFDSDLRTFDTYLINEINQKGCFLGGNSAGYPATASTLGIGDTGPDAATLTAIGDTARTGTQPPICAAMSMFYEGVWRQFLASWAQWSDAHRGHGIKGWYERFWGWDVGDSINQFRGQFDKIRDIAKQVGFDTSTVPTPSVPQTGMFDAAGNAIVKAATDVESAGEGLGGLAKVATYGVIGIGGLVAVSLLVRGGSASRKGITVNKR